MQYQEERAETTVAIHEVLARRRSPRAFDTRSVEPAKLRSLFEAARRAAPAFNAQPWYFIVATKDDTENFQRVLDCFDKFNQDWAKNAVAVGLSVASVRFEANGKTNRHAFHDVGQATATLAIQAAMLDLQVHQRGGIVPDLARKIFGIPDGYEVVAKACGFPGKAREHFSFRSSRRLGLRDERNQVQSGCRLPEGYSLSAQHAA
jgi:nitroreductase